MYQSRTTQRYNYVIRMVKSSTHADSALLETFFSEDPSRSKSLFYLIRKASICSDYADPQMDYQKAYRVLIDAVSEYINAYSNSSKAKHRLYNRMYAWCEHLGKQYQIENCADYLVDIPKLITPDLAVELVKDLHDQDGVSKEALGDKHHVSTKTIQVCLQRLSDKKHSDPMRVGGQAIHVPISHKKAHHRTDKRLYFTPNTMSPVIFQMNLMQVATLLQSLQLNYDSGNNIPLDLAVDTWSQLSDYAKERIRDIFCKKDPSFSVFLDIVEEAEHSDTYRFMTESEMMKDSDTSWNEKLDLAYKGSMVCNLSLMQPHRTRKNQRIIYDHDRQSFYAVSATNISGERLYFTEAEVYELEEA